MLWAMELKQIERHKHKGKPLVRAVLTEGTSQNCYDEWLIEGVSTGDKIEIYVGDETPNTRLTIAENEQLFSKYSKQERKGYREWGGTWEIRYSGKEAWNRKSYKGWCFHSITLTAYVNGIQVGEQCIIDNAFEVGYAPYANVLDNDVLVWVSPSEGVKKWVEEHSHIVESFAEVKMAEAKLMLKESLEKVLGKSISVKPTSGTISFSL